MRFLVDESTGPSVARWLREQGHQVFSIYDESRGITDAEVIQKAWQEEWILITNDKETIEDSSGPLNQSNQLNVSPAVLSLYPTGLYDSLQTYTP